MKKKILIFVVFLVPVLLFSLWTVVDKGYDKQNKIILLLKELIPSKISRSIRDTVFIVPDLKTRNEFLENQVAKFEQGYEGKIFKKEKIISASKINYEIKEFYLPFLRLDNRLGWAATESSRRAHYLEIVDDNVVVISGLSETIFFKKKNLTKNKLKQKKIENNISNFLNQNNLELIGIRDLFYNDGFLYISLQQKDSSGFTINVYRAKMNYEFLDFKIFFKTNEYWKDYNVYSGGRLEKFSNNKILFSIGYSSIMGAAQDMNSLLGKIVSIDKTSGSHEIISLGHRNPQGLVYLSEKNLVVNSEHGPKGGDEININYQNDKKIPNYGWDISSYGIEYNGTKPYKNSHEKYGFLEPFKYYVPSIGISEIVYTAAKNSQDRNKFYVSSLRAGSIYVIETDNDLKEIISEDRIFFQSQRIRDLEYDPQNDQFLILFEYTPSIGVLKKS